MKKVGITETILRDGHQSLIATRMTTDEMLPALEKLDAIGYNALECWGGATFDVCMRFLKEDPWVRLRKIRETVKNTKLQMLLRGQNLLGYKNYSDDVVEYFVKKSISNGISILKLIASISNTLISLILPTIGFILKVKNRKRDMYYLVLITFNMRFGNINFLKHVKIRNF